MAELQKPLTDRFDLALQLAHRVHRRQVRKGTEIPYVAHVMAVCALVLEYGGTEVEAIAALLHDTLEDAPPELGAAHVRDVIARDFGQDVLDIVSHCSDTTAQPKPPWRERKVRYIESLEHASMPALRVSAADKFHNVNALVRDYRRHGDALWDRFNPEAGKSGTLGYHRALANVFARRMAGPLAADLNRSMQCLEQLTGEVGAWPPV
jgi:(p)ppGpp synthase/HD superfamily hydrolase